RADAGRAPGALAGTGGANLDAAPLFAADGGAPERLGEPGLGHHGAALRAGGGAVPAARLAAARRHSGGHGALVAHQADPRAAGAVGAPGLVAADVRQRRSAPAALAAARPRR